jgi:hypothetical protein
MKDTHCNYMPDFENYPLLPLPEHLRPGDILAIDTDQGCRFVQVTHARSPYPSVLRAIVPSSAYQVTDISKCDTAFVAMVELTSLQISDSVKVRYVGYGEIPAHERAFPTFRLPIRNKSGDILYWWAWDGDGLKISQEAANAEMPLREVLTTENLCKRLCNLV